MLFLIPCSRESLVSVLVVTAKGSPSPSDLDRPRRLAWDPNPRGISRNFVRVPGMPGCSSATVSVATSTASIAASFVAARDGGCSPIAEPGRLPYPVSRLTSMASPEQTA